MSRGFAVSAGLSPEVAEPLATRCAQLGYGSMWSGDHGADGIETLAAFARAAPELGLGLAYSEREAKSMVASVERVDLDPARLTIAVTPASDAVAALKELRAGIPRARILIAVRSDEDLGVAGEGFDGAIANWMTPPMLAASRLELGSICGPDPNLVGIVHAAVGADAETRLGREEGFARHLPAYRERFRSLAADPGRTGVACDTAELMPLALEPYERACDELVIRGLAARRFWNLDRIATASAPNQSGGGPGSSADRPTSSSVSRETTAPKAK